MGRPTTPGGHPRTIGWFGSTAVAMGGINQSLFLLGALFVGQGTISAPGSAAASDSKAIKLLREATASGQPYNLALLDTQMPGLDGLTLARAIRNDSAICGLRLILLTTLGQTGRLSEQTGLALRTSSGAGTLEPKGRKYKVVTRPHNLG